MARHYLHGAIAGTASQADTGIDDTTPAANVATLVSDGASPTQAHVTTLNTNYAILHAALTSDDVVVAFNNSTVTTVTQLRAIFNAILTAAAGGGVLTA